MIKITKDHFTYWIAKKPVPKLFQAYQGDMPTVNKLINSQVSDRRRQLSVECELQRTLVILKFRNAQTRNIRETLQYLVNQSIGRRQADALKWLNRLAKRV